MSDSTYLHRTDGKTGMGGLESMMGTFSAMKPGESRTVDPDAGSGSAGLKLEKLRRQLPLDTQFRLMRAIPVFRQRAQGTCTQAGLHQAALEIVRQHLGAAAGDPQRLERLAWVLIGEAQQAGAVTTARVSGLLPSGGSGLLLDD